MEIDKVKTLDPITLEVVQALFINIVREMRATMIRTSYSPTLYEIHDFSCGLLDSKGELIGLSEDIPLHVFPMTIQTRAILDKFGDEIHPGDVFLMNDPYTGGTHLNDVAVAYPYFASGKLVIFIVVRAHFSDVGGMTPGSISGKATEIYQEGVRIPAVKVFEKGKFNKPLMETIFANMRFGDDSEGDFLSMMDTCRVAQKRLTELFIRYGDEVIEQCSVASLDRAETRMKSLIFRLPSGVYHYESYLENSGTSPDPLPIRVTMKIEGETMCFDFTGTAPQVAGSTNAGLAIPPTAVFIVVKSFLDPKSAVCGGSFRPIEVFAPQGTFINARLPATCGGFCEVERPLEGAVMGVLSQVIPHEVTGEPRMGANHTYIGGWDSIRKKAFLSYECPAGGTPAFLDGDGSSAVLSFNTGDVISVHPIETLENIQPLRVEGIELRVDSGGPGRQRGGLGSIRRIKLLAESAQLSVASERNVIPNNGTSGGYSAARNAFSVIREGKEIPPSDIPGKVTGFPLKRGDMVVMRSHGSGGFGDPLTRDPELVRQDVLEGYVSEERAKENYGVVIVGGGVDLKKTQELRKKLIAERKYIRVIASDSDKYDERGCRLCPISSNLASQMGVIDGELIEYVARTGFPLRAWIKVVDHLTGDSSPLGPRGREILKVQEGNLIEIRALSRFYCTK